MTSAVSDDDAAVAALSGTAPTSPPPPAPSHRPANMSSPTPRPSPVALLSRGHSTAPAEMALAARIAQFEVASEARLVQACMARAWARLVQVRDARPTALDYHPLAALCLMKWTRLTWSAHRSDQRPVWAVAEAAAAAALPLSDRLHRGILLPSSRRGSITGRSVTSMPSHIGSRATSRRASTDSQLRHQQATKAPVTRSSSSTAGDDGEANDTEDAGPAAAAAAAQRGLTLPLPRPSLFTASSRAADAGMMHLIFSTWRQWTSDIAALRRRCQQSRASDCVSRWRLYTATRIALATRHRILAAVVARRQTKKILHAWKHAYRSAAAVRVAASIQAGLAHLDRVQTLRYASQCFGSWSAWARDRADRRRTAVAAGSAMHRRRLLLAIGRWQQTVTRTMQQQQLAQSATARLARVRQASLLSKWKRHVQSTRRAKQLLLTAITHWREDMVSKAFLAWRAATATSNRIRGCTDAVRTANKRRSIAAALKCWRSHAARVKQFKAVIVAWQEASSSKRLQRAVGRWLTITQACKEARASSLEAGAHDRSKRMAAAFMAWKSASHTRRSRRLACQDAAKALLILQIRRGVNRWRSRAKTMRQTRSADVHDRTALLTRCFKAWALTARLSRRSSTLVASAARRFKHGRILAYLTHWQAWTEARLLHRAAVTHRKGHVMVAYFQAWKGHVAVLKAKRMEGYAAATRIQHFKLQRCLQQWRASSSHRAATRMKLHRFLFAWRQQWAGKAFRSWLEYAAACREWRDEAGRITGQVKLGALRRALRSWRSHASTQAAVKAQVKSAAHHSDVKVMRVYFDRLLAYSRIRREWRGKRAGLLAQASSARLKRALSHWLAQAAESRTVKRISTALVASAKHRSISKAFRGWRLWLATKQQRASKQAAATTAITTLLLKRAVAKLRLRAGPLAVVRRKAAAAKAAVSALLLRRALRQWATVGSRLNKTRTSKRRADAHQRTSLLRLAWSAFVSYHNKRQRVDALYRDVAPSITAIVNRNTVRQFFSCVQLARDAAAIDAAANEHHNTILLHKTFAGWRARVTEKSAARQVVDAAARRVVGTRLIGCLHRWRQWIVQEGRLTAMSDRAKEMMRVGLARRAFLCWARHVMTKKHLASLVTDMRAGRLEYAAISSLQLWRDHAAARKADRATASQVRGQVARHRLAACIRRWRSVAQQQVSDRHTAVEQALVRADRKRLSTALQHLKLHTVLCRARRMAIASLLSRMAVRKWRRAAVLMSAQVAALRAVIQSAARAQLALGVTAWRDHVMAQVEEEDAGRREARAEAVMQRSRLRRAVLTWQRNCAAMASERRLAAAATQAARQLERDVSTSPRPRDPPSSGAAAMPDASLPPPTSLSPSSAIRYFHPAMAGPVSTGAAGGNGRRPSGTSGAVPEDAGDVTGVFTSPRRSPRPHLRTGSGPGYSNSVNSSSGYSRSSAPVSRLSGTATGTAARGPVAVARNLNAPVTAPSASATHRTGFSVISSGSVIPDAPMDVDMHHLRQVHGTVQPSRAGARRLSAVITQEMLPLAVPFQPQLHMRGAPIHSRA